MRRRDVLGLGAALAMTAGQGARAAAPVPPGYRLTWFDAAPPGGGRAGSRDVTPAGDGTMWFCGQRDGTLNRLDPRDGAIRRVRLGEGAAPHGVIRGPDGAAWVTEGGQNAIARVDPADHRVQLWRLPERFANANLNTGVFDRNGLYWFTGQNGVYGRFDPKREAMQVWEAPRGPGAYGITRTPQGTLWYVSLAGNHLAQIEDPETGRVRIVEPPTPNQGARRVWSDSTGRLWISEWNSGNVSMHDPRDGSWKAWRLPGNRPRAYSVWVDPSDKVWLTDFPANAVVRFDPTDESFLSFPSDRPGANIRQMDGLPGEAWGGESGTDRILRIQYGL
ncbi:Vgb family protein [Belnapia rosea]|uniref:Virginiamycin B lyase n=1 Tax=Belnapia rosea TaxID=938405 RepID=A0A1G6QV36_9PROT|nr:lyase [Belnapia rosea]SDB63212.1 virginiamycin B lyase [Belnapia rosea]SDC96181.1 virginiamycin B lyase [Belnapia rosea]